MTKRRCWPMLLLPMLVLSGCPNNPPPDPAAPAAGASPSAAGYAGSLGTPIGLRTWMVQLDVYQLSVPFGSISRDNEFWKRVDETQLDMPTYDLLLKNGIRVGIGANSDWLHFQTLVDRYRATVQHSSTSPSEAGAIDLVMHENVEYQDVFYYNDRNALTGRTFEHCVDLFSVEFYAAKRNSGETLMQICPVVHGLRKRFEVTQLGEEREVSYSNPERLYDLHLEAVVPADHFLVIAPSRESKWDDLIGSAFLSGNGPAQRQETVLLLRPRLFSLTRLPVPRQ